MEEVTSIPQSNSANMQARPPIVVVLGHVDHGKSSLLEAIREDFLITAKESGGITQHIGAYEAEYQGKRVTFIDTPGHEAFSAMRSRGAKVADIAILVVAADEGVKPQTEEAIEQIKAASLPFIVALTKTDKKEANPERVKLDLAQKEIMVESLGGQVPSIEVSAVTKQGVPELLEMILLMADLEELRCDPLKPARGVIIESFVDRKRGIAATVLVRDGTLHQGDLFGVGSVRGKARILEDFRGEQVMQAGPSVPVVMLGFEASPSVGEEVLAYSVDSEAPSLSSVSQKQERSVEVQEKSDTPVLNLIIRADGAGSLEALEEIIAKIPQDKVGVRVLKADVGEAGEDDVRFAQSAGARILAYRTKLAPGIADLAERSGVTIDSFDVIYALGDRLRAFMEAIAEPEIVRVEKGKLKILAVFGVQKGKQVVGGRVEDGMLRKGDRVEVVRSGEVIGQGKIFNLQQNKEDAASVSKGKEAGLLFEGEPVLQSGDSLVSWQEERKKVSLS